MQSIEAILLDYLKSFADKGLVKASQTSNPSPLLIAYSGGIDSHVLLDAAVALWRQGLIAQPKALHFNHRMQSISDQWQAHCEALCRDYQIPIVCQRASQNETEKPLASELDARNARYQFFESELQKDQLLLMAHHQDDQAETLLFRLIRGTGVNGMAGMQAIRQLGEGQLGRPLLDIPREMIESYAKQHQLHWIEDPSNQATHYDRNFIRHQLLPLIQQRWSKANKNIAQFAQLASEQNEILEAMAKQDLMAVCQTKQRPHIDQLLHLPLARMKNLLHYWLKQLSGKSASHQEIMQIIQQLKSCHDREDRKITIKAANGWLREFKKELYFCATDEPQPLTQAVAWSALNQPVTLFAEYQMHCIPNAQASEPSFGLRPPKAEEKVSIRPRIGGEKVRLAGQAHHSSLKKVFQASKLPPWKRKWLPIVYYNDSIAVIPGIAVAHDFASQDEKAIVFELKTTAR